MDQRKELNSPNLRGKTKCVLYTTLIRPILTHGSECWPSQRRI